MSEFPQEEKFDPKFDYPEHENADKKNGTRLRTEKSFASILKEFGYKIIRSIASGNLKVTSIVPPASVCQSQNHLQTSHCSHYVFKHYVQKATQLQDPVERQKYISTGFLANMYVADVKSCGLIPMPVSKNEYLEGFMSDGSYCFARCLSREPLQNTLRIVGPEIAFTYDLTQELIVKPGNITLSVFNCQKKTSLSSLVFKDGTEYSLEYPSFYTENSISSDKNLVNTNLTPDDCYVWDKKNGYKAIIEFPPPKSNGVMGLFTADPVPTVHEKNVVIIKIYKTDASGKKLGQPLSTGTGNMLSYIQFDGSILWKLSDLFEEFQYDRPDYNVLDHSSFKRKYIKLIREEKYLEADLELVKVFEQEEGDPEAFIRDFPPEMDQQQIDEYKNPKHLKSQNLEQKIETRDKEILDFIKKPEQNKLKESLHKKEEKQQMVQPEINFHQDEVKFTYINNKQKLKSQIIIENTGSNNIIVKTKSNVQSRYAVKPVVCLIKPRTSVKVYFIALTQNLGNVDDISDKFLLTYADIGEKVLSDDKLNDFFKCSEVKFSQTKMPVIFCNVTGERLNHQKTKNVSSANMESNFNIRQTQTTEENRQESPVKTGVASSNLGASNSDVDTDLENKNLKQELQKTNARCRYLENQISKADPTKKKSGYELYHLVGVLILGMYLGNLFLSK